MTPQRTHTSLLRGLRLARTLVLATLFAALGLLASGCGDSGSSGDGGTGESSKGWVVWADYHGIDHSDIYAYDLASGADRVISTTPGLNDFPAISGEWVVWRNSPDGNEGGADIHVRNLTSGEERLITSGVASRPVLPVISGEWLVWMRTLEPPESLSLDLYAYNLASGEDRVITTPLSGPRPAISGEWVVWTDSRGATTGKDAALDIYGYNLETGEERLIRANVSYTPTPPVVSGDWVVWVDLRGGEYAEDIYAYNLTSGEERAICTAKGLQHWPAISGDWVVWVDLRSGERHPGIYAHDLSSGEERVIRKDMDPFPSQPAISGELVVWKDFSDLGLDSGAVPRTCEIHAYDLGSGEARVLGSAGGLGDWPAVSVE